MKKINIVMGLGFSIFVCSFVFAQGEQGSNPGSILEQQIARKCLGLQHWSMVKCVESEKDRLKAEDKHPAEKGQERGKAIFNQYCYVCHGFEGKGNGPSSGFIRKPVYDLTQPNVGKETDSELMVKITRGNAPMPGFTNEYFSKDDLEQLIKYIRTLSKKSSKS